MQRKKSRKHSGDLTGLRYASINTPAKGGRKKKGSTKTKIEGESWVNVGETFRGHIVQPMTLFAHHVLAPTGPLLFPEAGGKKRPQGKVPRAGTGIRSSTPSFYRMGLITVQRGGGEGGRKRRKGGGKRGGGAGRKRKWRSVG